jgi:hypothetical protein
MKELEAAMIALAGGQCGMVCSIHLDVVFQLHDAVRAIDSVQRANAVKVGTCVTRP